MTKRKSPLLEMAKNVNYIILSLSLVTLSKSLRVWVSLVTVLLSRLLKWLQMNRLWLVRPTLSKRAPSLNVMRLRRRTLVELTTKTLSKLTPRKSHLQFYSQEPRLCPVKVSLWSSLLDQTLARVRSDPNLLMTKQRMEHHFKVSLRFSPLISLSLDWSVLQSLCSAWPSFGSSESLLLVKILNGLL